MERDSGLYPNRLSTEVDHEIAEIEKILSGELPILELSPPEKTKLFTWENQFGEELEKISELRIKSETFCPQYFLSEEGRADFASLFPGLEIPQTVEEINRLFLSSRAAFLALPEKTLDDVFSRSIKYFNQHLENQLINSLAADGTIGINSMTYLEKKSVVLHPDKGREKLERLVKMKKQLKSFQPTSQQGNFEKAQAAIAKIYLARINESLAGSYPVLFAMQKKADLLGIDALDEDEQFLRQNIRGPSNKAKTLHRLDKLTFGSGREVDDRGNYKTLGKEIMTKFSAVLDDASDFAIQQEKGIISKGLDPQKVLAANVTPEQRREWGRRVLAAYGVLSEEPEETYVKSRRVPAADGKWQFILRSDRKTKAINVKQQVVLDSDNQMNDIIHGLIVTCGHEIEGHVLQALNKQKIPLRIFDKIGGDRRALLSEGGAVHNEATLIEEIFGYQRGQSTHYLLAIEAKKRGGDYFQCLMMAYGILLSNTRSKYDLSQPDQQEKFQKEITKKLKELIPRVQRIFSGVSLSDTSGYLPETKDTVYLEQDILMQKLAKKGLTKLAYVGGLNLRNIATLLHLGLLKMEDILEPKMITRKIWEEIKADYQ